jgi:hypothetical protein
MFEDSRNVIRHRIEVPTSFKPENGRASRDPDAGIEMKPVATEL